MRAGKLRHRVTIEQRQHSQDPETGEMLDGWAAVASVWASIEPLSVNAFIAAGAEQSKVTARIVMRAREVDSTMRIVHKGNVYNIHGVLHDPKSGKQYVTLPVSEGVDNG